MKNFLFTKILESPSQVETAGIKREQAEGEAKELELVKKELEVNRNPTLVLLYSSILSTDLRFFSPSLEHKTYNT